MLHLRSHAELKSWRESLSPAVCLGLVPTMGALHGGHASLLEQAVSDNDIALASVFVNPLQFNEGADFKRYPRTLDEDCALLESYGMDAVYLPDREDMYPDGYETRVRPGPGGELFEGDQRPGHFEGMLTVVLKLFLRIAPDRAYFGEKDAQQLWLVRRMAADLDLPMEVVGCRTVREINGLAMSSRNAFLSPEQRDDAAAIHRAMLATREVFRAGEREIARLERILVEGIHEAQSLHVEYAQVVDDRTFRPADPADQGSWRVVVAARMEQTRLIDNLRLGRA